MERAMVIRINEGLMEYLAQLGERTKGRMMKVEDKLLRSMRYNEGFELIPIAYGTGLWVNKDGEKKMILSRESNTCYYLIEAIWDKNIAFDILPYRPKEEFIFQMDEFDGD